MKQLIYNHSKNKNTTIICIQKISPYVISKRTMINSRCFFAIRAAYHVAQTISNHTIINKEEQETFISGVVHNALSYTQGIPQHKAVLWKHMSHQRVYGEYFYDSFQDQISYGQLVKYEPHTLVDFRTVNELPVLSEYIKAFNKNIVWTYSTLDARPASFPTAKQSNPDFWVMIDNAFGFKTAKCTYQDEKSGMDMIRHATRGSIGILCYDEFGRNIQMTSKPITIQDLILSHRQKLRDIKDGLIHDGSWSQENNPFKTILNRADKIVDDMENIKNKSFKEFEVLHNKLQHLLWDNLQCNPNYTRSISFIFLKQVINSPMTDKESIFSQAFKSKLKEDYLYDLDKKGDLKELYHAFIHAGNKIDSDFINKLYYLHKNGVTLTNDILFILKEITKHAVH